MAEESGVLTIRNRELVVGLATCLEVETGILAVNCARAPSEGIGGGGIQRKQR